MLRGFLCPAEKDKRVCFSECLAECEDYCLPLFLPAKLADEWKRNPTRLSVTELLYCLRKAYYSRVLDYYTSPTNVYGLVRGTYIHEGLNELRWVYGDKAVEQYQTFTLEHFGEYITISGRWDVKVKRHAKSPTELIDLKTYNDFGMKHLPGDRQALVKKLCEDKPEYIKQLAIYYLGSPELGLGEPVIGALWFLTMTGFRIAKPFHLNRTWEKAARLCRERGYLLMRAVKYGELPPRVGKDQEWLCKNCDFRLSKYPWGVCKPDDLEKLPSDASVLGIGLAA